MIKETSQEKYRKKADYYRKAALKYYHENKEKCAEKAKKWRLNNKEYIIEQQRLKKRLRKLEAINYLGGKCEKCGLEFHPSVYEFHHKDPTVKEKDPSKMLQLSWLRVVKELDKCSLLCANCHRLTHHEESYK
jgi:hypothetical protein